MTWIQTYTGHRFDFATPEPDAISILDIAHALALCNRFAGHTTVPYSVAEHSVRVALRVRELASGNTQAMRMGLLHDAAEAYLGDLVRPLKSRVDMSAFGWLERRVERVIVERFWGPLMWDGDGPWGTVIYRADAELLHTEARDLLMGGPREWAYPGQFPLHETIVPRSWQEAERWFLETFQWLFPEDREAQKVAAALTSRLERIP